MNWTLALVAIIHLQAILTSGQTIATEKATNTDEHEFHLEGRDGLPGRDGRDGMVGPRGSPGFPGFPGHKGEQGEIKDIPGSVGDTGPTGVAGEKGSPGDRGTDGDRGPPGIQGSKGSRGSRGLIGPPAASNTQRGGVSYTRWGKLSCRTGSSLVYAGTSGIPFPTHGGGSNYVCMPLVPEYTLPFRPGVQGQSSIYGVEYEGPPLVSNRDQHNAPCAVCYVSDKNTALMIPAKSSCPTGWMQEYYGYIMSENRLYRRTEYVCVDRAMDSIPGSQNHIESGHFYHVEAHCDGMACPPYNDYKELNCVVCTK